MLGGAIGVDSTPGVGSEFWFTTRLEKSDEAEPSATLDLRGRRALVADDHAPTRQLVQDLISRWQGCCDGASDAAQTLTLLHAARAAGQPYDLLLLDAQLPDADGQPLLQSIQATPALAATPLILLTALGYPTPTTPDQNPVGHVVKPLRQSQLATQLQLALGQHPAPATATPHPALHALTARPRRILLAEDNAVNQKVALTMLKKLGFSADAVANGREALAALADIDYDLVLMDCEMPEMDGFEATAHIRAGASGVSDPAVPVVAMTAHALQGDRERCLAAGMNDYISKPVQVSTLTAVLERWLPQT